MDDSNVWSVDRLAASNLLARMGVEATAQRLEVAEQHFASHRETALEWAAKRARSSMIEELEEASLRHFPEHEEEWCAGFQVAELQVASMGTRELLRTDFGKASTKGQILRRLVRQARTG